MRFIFLLVEDELLHEVLLLSLHLCQGGVLDVQTVKLSFLLHDQSSQLLLLSLTLLSVRFEKVPGTNGLDFLLLNLLGHSVKYHYEAVSYFLSNESC